MMDSLKRLREKGWADMVENAVRNSPLRFRPWHQMMYERDRTFLKRTSEMFEGQHFIEFAQGAYDNFAAPVVRMNPDGSTDVAFATDEYYFSRLALLSLTYGRERIYRECERLYAMTTDTLSNEVLVELDRASREYGEDEGVFFNMMLHVYYGMVAEEHYQRMWSGAASSSRTGIGKMMKMHALHRIFVECDDIDSAATECVSMAVDVIRSQAEQMGIVRDVTWVPYRTMYDDPGLIPVVERGSKKGVRM